VLLEKPNRASAKVAENFAHLKRHCMNCIPPEQDFSQLDKMEQDKLLGVG
jgi:hypothetical protein